MSNCVICDQCGRVVTRDAVDHRKDEAGAARHDCHFCYNEAKHSQREWNPDACWYGAAKTEEEN